MQNLLPEKAAWVESSNLDLMNANLGQTKKYLQ